MKKWNGENELIKIFNVKFFEYYSYIIVQVDKIEPKALRWLRDNIRAGHISESRTIYGHNLTLVMSIEESGVFFSDSGARISLDSTDRSYICKNYRVAKSIDDSYRFNEIVKVLNGKYAYDTVIEEVVLIG